MVSFFSLLTSMVYDHIEITIKQKRHRATKCGHWACRPFSCGHPLFRLPSRWSGTSIVAMEANHQRQAFLRCNGKCQNTPVYNWGYPFPIPVMSKYPVTLGYMQSGGDVEIIISDSKQLLQFSWLVFFKYQLRWGLPVTSWFIIYIYMYIISINHSLDIPRVNHSYYSCKPM